MTPGEIYARRNEYGLTAESLAELSGFSVKTIKCMTPADGGCFWQSTLHAVEMALDAYAKEVVGRENTALSPITSEDALYRAIDRAASDAMLVESIYVPTQQREYVIARQIAFHIVQKFLSRRKAALVMGWDRTATIYWQHCAEAWSDWLRTRAQVAESRVRAAILQACLDNPDNPVYLTEGKQITIRK